MKFDDSKAVEYAVTEAELRVLLRESGWEYAPKENRPIPKRLWNCAIPLYEALVNHGFEPIRGSVEALRNLTQGRINLWADRVIRQIRILSQDPDLRRYFEGIQYAREAKERSLKEVLGDLMVVKKSILGGDLPHPPQIEALIQEFNRFVLDWNAGNI